MTPPFAISRIGRSEWTPSLRAEIHDLVSPSYVEPSMLLEREFERNDVLYAARDSDGALRSFFMVGRHLLRVAGEMRHAVFLGLSATREDTRSSGVAGGVYGAFVRDGAAWEQTLQGRLLLWATTATPVVYNAAQRLFEELQPHVDGTFDPSTTSIAMAIRQQFYPHAASNGHPFVLKRAATGTRYSPQEQSRIQQLTDTKRFTMFTELGVDETQGDRLLITCRLPRQHAEVRSGS